MHSHAAQLHGSGAHFARLSVVGQDGETKDTDELVKHLRHLQGEAEKLHKQIHEAAERAVERRRLGVDRRRATRSDRRQPPKS